jgi:hypothetical protein
MGFVAGGSGAESFAEEGSVFRDITTMYPGCWIVGSPRGEGFAADLPMAADCVRHARSSLTDLTSILQPQRPALLH